MKILMLNFEYPPLGGGAGNAMYYLLREFSNVKDLKIDVITSSPKRYSVEKLSDNITVYKLNVMKKSHHYQTFFETFFWSVETMFFMDKLMKENDYDLCHAWFGWPSGFIGYMKKKKMPYIVSLRGSDVPGFNPRFDILDKTIFNRLSRKVWADARYVTANSEGLKKLALKTDKRDMQVIYNGVDTKEFFPRKKNHKGIVLLCAARLIKRKGIEYLIRAMPKIVSKKKDVKLRIVGEGPEKEYLEGLSEKLAVKNNIDFVGKKEHDSMPEIYQDADIFILPSLFEGMSNTVLEAMASGLPIITTDTGGTKELIKGNGIIVKQKSPEEIADAVIGLFNESRKKKFEIKSREIALSLGWGNVSKEYLEIYKKAIK